MTPSETRFFDAPDGVRLAWRELGEVEARPVLLLHGYFSDAATNWIKYGHAAAIAARGLRVILPDLRAHGESERPHDPAAYPPDVLASDAEALIAHLGLSDYDLGGYSLGARTAVRMLARGARPRRVVIAGMGLDGIVDVARRTEHFCDVLTNLGRHERGTPAWMAAAFLKTTGGDPVALLGLLGSFVSTPLAEVERLGTPALVVSGVDDHDNGSAAALADVLPNARYSETPGNHMSAVMRAELGEAMAAFLAT